MTSTSLVARAPRFLAGVVLALSGGYMLVYLYRWEWNRAILSGLFFVAAEVALGTSMILRRLRALEERAAITQEPSPAALERLHATPVDRPDPFAWLTPRDGQLHVFVPVLLGAGAILSVLAYLVERVAEATAVPGIDRRLASRLDALAPPSGGLLGDEVAGAGPVRPPRPPSRIAATTVALAAVAIVVWLGGQWLVEATQTRPDPSDRPAITVIELSVAQRDVEAGGAEEAAEALWVECRSTLGSLPVFAAVDPRGGDRVDLVLEPGIGRLGARRLTGCLSDLRLNLVQATVLSVDSDE